MKALLCTIAVALCAGTAAATEPAASPATPALKVTTLDGATFDLSTKRGKWIIVNYWATWCGPCIKEMPALSAFDDAHDDVEVIGLAYEDTDRDELVAFLAKRPVGYPVAQIDIDDPPRDFGVPRGLPVTWIIRPDGSVARQFVGPVNEKDLAKVTGKHHAPAEP